MVLGVLTASWASGEDSASKMVPKRTPKCSQDGPRGSKEADLGEHGGEVGAKGAMLANLAPKMANMAALGAILAHFTDLRELFTGIWKMQKTLENRKFFKVFGGGRVGRGGIWIPFWAMLVHLGSKLSCLGSSRQHLPTS